MKLCSINCETKSHNLPLATYISGKIIFHALIYTVSFYWVASCAVSIKPTEDGWESHLKSENTNHRFICLVERKMFHESQFLQLQLNYFSKTPEKKLLQSWFSCIYLFALTADESPGWGLPESPGLCSWAPPSPACPSHGHLGLPKAGWQRFGSHWGGYFVPTCLRCQGELTAGICVRSIYCHSHPERGLDPLVRLGRGEGRWRRDVATYQTYSSAGGWNEPAGDEMGQSGPGCCDSACTGGYRQSAMRYSRHPLFIPELPLRKCTFLFLSDL